jgi:superfamily II DNA or RNA helicase
MKEESIVKVLAPSCTAKNDAVDGNPIRQVLISKQEATIRTEGEYQELTLANGNRHRILKIPIGVDPNELALVIPTSVAVSNGSDLSSIDDVRWLGTRSRKEAAEVLSSLQDAFNFLEEDLENQKPGMRVPQLGALHAVLGYWTTATTDPATVVMPTGTGKTEAMLAMYAKARPDRLLVIVPSDALRDQLTSKFESFGLLQDFGVISDRSYRPVVGQIRHAFRSTGSAEAFVNACNVIITTPSALNASDHQFRLSVLEGCSHLFVDEAHHVAAATWKHIRDDFQGKEVVQFTATPFREDGKHIGGRLIYAFPLREAQRLGYFSRINYISVVNFQNQDLAIASRAIDQLREDLAGGLDHILMARVMRKTRADEILSLYKELASDLMPTVLHSGVAAKTRRAALEAVRSRKSRIIICVDMLGEGFDLPELKIAAIHDPHKSLGITLQFVGRFARVAPGRIGEASVVVGRPELDYDQNLRSLYSEDADWNVIIRDLSETAVGYQEDISQFEAGFGSLPDEVSLRNLVPKMSTVVYRTQTETWNPEGSLEIFPEDKLLTVPLAINPTERVAWFVTKEETQVRWGDLQTVQEVNYDLYVLYWDASRQLLYINSSNTNGHYQNLAAAVGGDVERITGENVYRVMAEINRLVPTNVGVLDVRNRARRFSMHVGADVSEGFPVVEAQTKTQTNIFAYGYENGERVSIGGSLRGRVWSHRVADTLKHWVDWCDWVGGKLIDDTISVDEVIRNFIRPEVVEERPALIPLSLEWPWEIYRSTTEDLRLMLGGAEWPLVDTDLRLLSFESVGPIRFEVGTPHFAAEYSLVLGAGGMNFTTAGEELRVVSRSRDVPLSEYLQTNGLTINFEQDAQVVPPGILLRPNREMSPFDIDKLHPLDWEGVNQRKESQGPEKAEDSIQARVIRAVIDEAEWDLVLDDDGRGEIADVIAMRIDDGSLIVRLIHCKYSTGQNPGARVADLYEVCGQAQKSVQWRRNMGLLFQHLIRREKRRNERDGRSGIERGTGEKLYELEDRSRLLKAELSISIAQPGLSKTAISASQRELLASTDLYVYETFNAAFDVYCSA